MKKLASKFANDYIDSLEGKSSKNVVVVDYVHKAILDTVKYFIGFDEEEKILPPVELDHILRVVSTYTNISIRDIKKKTRGKDPIVYARHLYCYMAKRLTKHILARISEEVNRDHSTALHSVQVIEYERDIYPDVQKDVDRLIIWISVEE